MPKQVLKGRSRTQQRKTHMMMPMKCLKSFNENIKEGASIQDDLEPTEIFVDALYDQRPVYLIWAVRNNYLFD